MKKLIMTTVAAFGFAALAQADVLNSTGFEDYGSNPFRVDTDDTGSSDGTRYQYWTGTGDFSQTVLKTYAEAGIAAPAIVPDAFTNAANTTFLSVDTGNDVMYRKAGADAGSVDLTQGAVFFDANVKFTASESDVKASAGDKLLVWLKGDENSQTTNLVVTAGILDERGVVTTNETFVTDADVEADTWYRLTVKAGVDDKNCTYFNVYIDDNLVSSDETTTFYSLVQSGSARYTIAEAGFQGTGALDNVVWTTTDPFPAPVVDTVALAIDLKDDDAVFAGLAANAEVVNVLAPAPIVATVDDVITFVAKVPDGYTPTVEDYDLQKSAEKDEDDNYAYTFTVTVTQAMINNGLTLTITVTADGGEEPTTVVTPTAAEIESGEIPVTGETTAIKIGTIDVPIEAFDVNAGVATVKAPVVAESAEAAGDAFVIDDESDKVTINVNPVAGLYYGVSAKTDLDALARPAALTQYDGTNAAEIFTVSKPGAEKGFFKVYSDVKE